MKTVADRQIKLALVTNFLGVSTSMTLNPQNTLLKRIIILLLYTDCQGGRTAATVRHVSFSQITCCRLACVRWQKVARIFAVTY